MARSSTRLSLTELDSTDSLATYSTQQSANMATLDAAALYQSGTLGARPAAPAAGTFYYATDVALTYFYNGSGWGLLMTASPWVALTLGGTFSYNAGSSFVPSARIKGDVVEFQGQIYSNPGTVAANTTWATVPAAMKPAQTVGISQGAALYGFSIFVSATVSSSTGAIVVSNSFSAGAGQPQLSLDGMSYSLS